jgi:L-lactate dehydrogenase complex protein LldG
MSQVETNTGIFSRFKGLFSNNNNSAVETATDEVVETEETVFTPLAENSIWNSTESITEKEIPIRTVEVTAPVYALPDQKDLDIRFATKFIQGGGKFIFAENMQQAVENLKLMSEDLKWSHVFSWENEIKDAFAEYNFQRGSIGYTIENSDAAISLCECLLADEGTIILNPKQASRRRLSCFPKTHIIIADVAHLVASETEGLERFQKMHKGELPSLIKLGVCNTGHFYDKQRLILNAEGTEDIYVILVDEVIPPSLRP